MINKYGNNILDTPKGQSVEFIFTPNRLVSLLDMLPIARKLVVAVDRLELGSRVRHLSKLLKSPDDLRSLPNESNSLNEGEIEEAKNVLNWLEREMLTDLELKHSLRKLNAIRRVISGNELIPIRHYLRDIKELQNLVESELSDILFGYISAEKKPYFKNRFLFGEDVCEKFPSARNDIKEAGTCYAHGLYTATVFHLMRAVEVGAKVMVSAMKAEKHITVFDKGTGKKVKKPIELCDWGTLIKGLETALRMLEQGTKINAIKKNDLVFYSHAVAQFRNFKDAWRNNVSHSRKIYNAGETKDIMENTKHFLNHLAERVKEKL